MGCPAFAKGYGGARNPLYENLMVSMLMDTIKSTSRRQGREGDRPSEGSRSANVRADGQKPHTRLSSWASWHNTTKPAGSEGRVNAAVVHGKFTSLSGEICLPCGRRLMSKIRRGFTRLTKNPAYPFAVGGYGSSRETRNRQRLMRNPAAPCMATCRVSRQKSAEGTVGHWTEGPNAERKGVVGVYPCHTGMHPFSFTSGDG
jgi:hypothetical protein